jgi:hypothetical protein
MSEMSGGNVLWQLDLVLLKPFYDSARAGIWKEDELTDPVTGKFIRYLRGVDYEYGFEIVLNKEPALKKVLDNIRMITNKSLPFEIVYTTSEDENDAAVNIWGSVPGDRVLRQKKNYSK